MQDFSGKLAVITGGGTGMGRALARKLAAEGCSVAMCDVSQPDMDETIRLALSDAPQGVKVTGFVADVSMEDRLNAFRDDLAVQHDTDHVHLVFNNAGIGGGGSFVTDERERWERTFNVCWGGVYLTSRVFLPMLIRAPEGRLVNVSSVNGFWASLGAETPHTAYSAAKFAVKGFTEALITDLRLNAPHVKCSVVMPGHIGTNIAINSMRDAGLEEGSELADTAEGKEMLAGATAFRDNALTSADAAADIILEGVRAGQWRILVGPDAMMLDAAVRQAPESAYDDAFREKLAAMAADAGADNWLGRGEPFTGN